MQYAQVDLKFLKPNTQSQQRETVVHGGNLMSYTQAVLDFIFFIEYLEVFC
ncbi:MAG: hypothetical protein LBJ00_06305 [Planctomycetaceae bacterium]|jgi:hypothetical protein|nr:hypothetical protein [Planctomycetaceae bacterium]